MMASERHETLRRLEASGLRGRGGGWFETHRKWRAVLAEDGVPVVVANGGEGEPGSMKDRFVMRTRPQDVLRGLIQAMETLGADRGYVYLKGSFHEEEARLIQALQSMGGDARVSVHRGDDTYVGGEETALLESIEGRIAWPRPKPPRPASVGLFGRPTLVQNIDTLARVPDAVRLAADFPATETLTLTLWGDIRNAGVFEVRFGRTLRGVIDNEGGGAAAPIGLVFPNGAQGMPLLEEQLDTPLDPDSLAALGSSLGTASILALAADTLPSSMMDSIARFFERESCGQCPPCVLGTTNLRELVTGAKPATHRLTPQNAIKETASFMSMHGYCTHSRAGAAAVTGLFARWQDDVIRQLRDGETPAGLRPRDPFAPGSTERQALDTFLQTI